MELVRHQAVRQNPDWDANEGLVLDPNESCELLIRVEYFSIGVVPIDPVGVKPSCQGSSSPGAWMISRRCDENTLAALPRQSVASP